MSSGPSKTRHWLRRAVLALAVSPCMSSAFAEMTVIRAEGTAATTTSASLYFNAGVNDRSISSLLAALSDISAKYPGIQNVNLYINSSGGSMEAGYVAYEFLRRYPLKVNAINAATTDSAATMLYCATADRYAEPLSRFLLHPAAVGISLNGYLKPDQAKQAFEDAEQENLKFSDIYKDCVKLPANDITTLLSSESNRRRLDYAAAKGLGLITQELDQLPRTPDRATYFITDGAGR